jgi:GTP cyclohydrolase I
VSYTQLRFYCMNMVGVVECREMTKVSERILVTVVNTVRVCYVPSGHVVGC